MVTVNLKSIIFHLCFIASLSFLNCLQKGKKYTEKEGSFQKSPVVSANIHKNFSVNSSFKVFKHDM